MNGLLQSLTALQRRLRARRMRHMASLLGLSAKTRVLDVGGTADIWQLLPVRPRVVFLNQARAAAEIGAGETVLGDGLALPFADASFDVVFSNSVIEHTGNAEHQEKFAREVRRVGRAYWVQTPNRWFPLEQHLWMPLVHWLPKGLQPGLVAWCSLWRLLVRPAPDERDFYFRHYCRDVRLLGPAALSRLFPDARLQRERLLGLTKSLVVWRPRNQ